jgi:hypothetical protein
LIPRLCKMTGQQNDFLRYSNHAFTKRWALGDGSELLLLVNLADEPLQGIELPPGRVLYSSHVEAQEQRENDQLPPWFVIWYLNTGAAAT